jgi:uncharacterized protein (DUF488 family)
MIKRLYTIGVYGKTESQFFNQLKRAGIDTFCDIRQRRGVRGPDYAFANSKRLQASLANRGIAYRHVPELAPTTDMRESQYEADRQKGVAQRARVELGEVFKRRYLAEILESFDSQAFLRSLLPDARRVVLFCVEATAEACHRSLAAKRLHADWKVPVEHL